jgi:hypothetical protein
MYCDLVKFTAGRMIHIRCKDFGFPPFKMRFQSNKEYVSFQQPAACVVCGVWTVEWKDGDGWTMHALSCWATTGWQARHPDPAGN